MILERFVKQSGGIDQAAGKVFVSVKTFQRWIKGSNKPKGLHRKRLEELGVVVCEPIKRGSRRMSLERFVVLAGSQTRAADLIGVSRNQLAMWLEGKSVLSLASVARLNDLGVMPPGESR